MARVKTSEMLQRIANTQRFLLHKAGEYFTREEYETVRAELNLITLETARKRGYLTIADYDIIDIVDNNNIIRRTYRYYYEAVTKWDNLFLGCHIHNMPDHILPESKYILYNDCGEEGLWYYAQCATLEQCSTMMNYEAANPNLHIMER